MEACSSASIRVWQSVAREAGHHCDQPGPGSQVAARDEVVQDRGEEMSTPAHPHQCVDLLAWVQVTRVTHRQAPVKRSTSWRSLTSTDNMGHININDARNTTLTAPTFMKRRNLWLSH